MDANSSPSAGWAISAIDVRWSLFKVRLLISQLIVHFGSHSTRQLNVRLRLRADQVTNAGNPTTSLGGAVLIKRKKNVIIKKQKILLKEFSFLAYCIQCTVYRFCTVLTMYYTLVHSVYYTQKLYFRLQCILGIKKTELFCYKQEIICKFTWHLTIVSRDRRRLSVRSCNRKLSLKVCPKSSRTKSFGHTSVLNYYSPLELHTDMPIYTRLNPLNTWSLDWLLVLLSLERSETKMNIVHWTTTEPLPLPKRERGDSCWGF